MAVSMIEQAETLGDETLRLLKERDAFRKQGQWQEADSIRAALAALDVEICDLPDRTRWRLK